MSGRINLKKVVFNFSDANIKNEMFIEDINNILNVGEVPNLYNMEEIEEKKLRSFNAGEWCTH